MTIEPTVEPTALPTPAASSGTAIPQTMRAVAQSRYGRPDEVLQIEQVPVPAPHDRQVLVRVHTASVHVGDLVFIQGEPVIARLAIGLRRPSISIPGTDVAGTVVAVGDDVTTLAIGDQVFGWCDGAFAEYACADEDHFVPTPAAISLAHAAAVGVSASTALQLLRGRVERGQRVLINGASGGLGSFAVQIAVAMGAEVTGVCGPSNVETVRSLGASHVIDYTRDDFTRSGERYDFILDNVANHSLAAVRRALTSDGVLQSNNGTSGGRWFGTMGTVIQTAVVSKFTRRQAGPSIKFSNRDDLLALRQMIEDGSVTPLIDRSYALTDAARAVSHVGGGHARGTVLIRVDDSDQGAHS